MRGIYLLLCAMSVSLALCACDNGDDHSYKIPVEVLKAFEQQFPQAVRVDWEKEGKYYVAEFVSPYNGLPGTSEGVAQQLVKHEMQAWYDPSANWRMTVVDYSYDLLPDNVKNGFRISKFANWRVDDVDVVELRGEESIVVIEVENGGKERSLYFNLKGELVKETHGDSHDFRGLI